MLQLLDHLIDGRGWDRPLRCGDLDTLQELAAIVRLDLARTLHHLQRPLLDVFVGGETAAATDTLAAAPYRPPLPAGAGIDDAILQVVTEGAPHGSSLAAEIVELFPGRARLGAVRIGDDQLVEDRPRLVLIIASGFQSARA